MHSFPQLIIPRLVELRSQLEGEIWNKRPSSISVHRTRAFLEHKSFDEAVGEDFQLIDEFPHFWGDKFEQVWFRVDVSDSIDQKKRFFFWEDGGEATVYLDGIPYAGIDIPHPYCRIPDGVGELYIEAVCMQTGIWAPNPHNNFTGEKGSELRPPRIATRNEDYWQAYLDLDLLMDILKEDYKSTGGNAGHFNKWHLGYREKIEKATPLFRSILRKLDHAANRYEREGISAFRNETRQILESIREEKHGVKAIHTGHAHIDLVWLWPENCGVFKATHTFSTALRLMEQFPEFRFGYSQPASYEAVSKHAPKLMEEVKSRIQEGQWELTGASYVENDTQLPCGEAFLRGLLIGQDMTQDLRGEEASTYWLPDVFGYSGCTPKILRAAGVKYFYTTKLSWSVLHRHPYQSFNWIGDDGSTVLAHISTGHGYNEDVNVGTIRSAELTYQQADIHNEMLFPTGYGDGGGGPTEKMCERVKRLKNLQGAPACEWDLIESFFDRLGNIQEQLPDYEGELYFEYHRGTFTTHGELKAAFRALERALQILEAAHAITGIGEIDPHYWKRLVFAQFHDYIPGSSIHEVYAEAVPELTALTQKALKEAEVAISKATGSKEDALFNPNPLPKEVWTHVNGERGRAILPPFSGRAQKDLSPIPCKAPVKVSQWSIENNRLQASFNSRGQIESLTVDGVQIPHTAPLAQLEFFPDNPHNFEAWEIDRTTLDNGSICNEAATIKILEDTPLMACLQFSKKLTDRSQARINYRLRADSPVLEIEFNVDWQDEAALLKLNFPTSFKGRMARSGSPFGSTLRNQQKGPSHAEAQWEVCGNRWACVSDDNESEGLFIATEAKYGFSARAGLLTLSLVKSAKIIHSANEKIRKLNIDSEFSDLGSHHIKLVVGRFHNLAPREEQPVAWADHFFTPPLAYAGPSTKGPFEGLMGGDSLHIQWIKPMSDGSILLRLHETLGYRGTCLIQTINRVIRTDARGNEEAVLTDKKLPFQPYELITVRLITDQ